MWCVAIFLIGISSTLTGINFLVTIMKMRAPGMTFTRMPLFVWAQLATAMLNMIATTALAAALAALFLERQFNVPFYDPGRGGSPCSGSTCSGSIPTRRVHHDPPRLRNRFRSVRDVRA
jgi:cytochrome c oxidase subunit 1